MEDFDRDFTAELGVAATPSPLEREILADPTRPILRPARQLTALLFFFMHECRE